MIIWAGEKYACIPHSKGRREKIMKLLVSRLVLMNLMPNDPKANTHVPIHFFFQKVNTQETWPKAITHEIMG